MLRKAVATDKKPAESVAEFPPVNTFRDLATSDIEAATISARQAVSASLDLERFAASDIDSVKRVANVGRIAAQKALQPQPGDENDLTEGFWFKSGRNVDDWFSAIPSILSRKVRWASPTVRRVWTPVGVMLSVVAAVFVVLQMWWGATLLVLLRILISSVIGGQMSVSLDSQPSTGHGSTVVYRCLAAHATDAVVLTAIAWALLETGNPVPSFLVLAAVAWMLMGTLMRVAALQVGVRVHRLTLERVVRSTSIIGALAAQAAYPTVAIADWPLLSAAGLGCAIYALGECLRTVWRLHKADIEFGSVPSVSIIAFAEPSEAKPSGVYKAMRGNLTVA